MDAPTAPDRAAWPAAIGHALTGVLLIVVTALLGWLSTRHTVEADWTAAGRHTLSPASLELLANLDGPLSITAYASEQTALRDAVRRFVARYQRHHDGIALHFVNPDAVPDEARALGIRVDGELVLRHGERLEHVRSDSEQEFANALQRLLRGGERWVAFLEGHGERSPLGAANHDLGSWARLLKSRGFSFNPLNLAERRAIPDNTAVLVIAGPQADVLPGETQLMRDWLERGGNLLWLLEPGALSGLEPLAADLGLRLESGTVIDAAGELVGVRDPTIALVTASLYGTHRALQGFTLTTYFPGAGALAHGGDAWQAAALFTTGTHTWLESGPLTGEVAQDAGELAGPLQLGFALTRTAGTTEQRVVAIADGDFLSNAYAGNTGNMELGLRLMNWLAHDDRLIEIPARTAGDRRLALSDTTVGVLGIVLLFVLPALFTAVALALWWRRRRL
jgi:ABC-type uncharacterized transport system involved in gliding motility auxiliary subunit